MTYVLFHSLDGYFGPFTSQALALKWAITRADLAHDHRPAEITALALASLPFTTAANLQGPTEHSVTAAREAIAERFRQDVLWGFQHLPAVVPTPRTAAVVPMRHDALGFAFLAETYKRHNQQAAEDGTLDWAGVLLEEVFEALSSDTLDQRRQELVQVAAVALAAVEDYDYRRPAPRPTPADAARAARKAA